MIMILTRPVAPYQPHLIAWTSISWSTIAAAVVYLRQPHRQARECESLANNERTCPSKLPKRDACRACARCHGQRASSRTSIFVLRLEDQLDPAMRASNVVRGLSPLKDRLTVCPFDDPLTQTAVRSSSGRRPRQTRACCRSLEAHSVPRVWQVERAGWRRMHHRRSECTCPLLRQSRERCVDLVCGARIQDTDLLPEGAPRRLHVFRSGRANDLDWSDLPARRSRPSSGISPCSNSNTFDATGAVNARDVAAWSVEAGDKSKLDRVSPSFEDNRDRGGRRLGRQCSGVVSTIFRTFDQATASVCIICG